MNHPARAPTPDDRALFEAFQAGDDGAFELLYGRYRERASAYAWRLLRRREEAEEVVTEAFIRVVEGAWRPTGSFKSYLFTVVHRLCVDRIRRQRTRARFLPFLRRAAGEAMDPEAALLCDPRSRALEEALSGLPEEHRAAVLLFYGQDMSSKEVAEVLGCSDQQVRSQLSYARRRLRKELKNTTEAP